MVRELDGYSLFRCFKSPLYRMQRFNSQLPQALAAAGVAGDQGLLAVLFEGASQLMAKSALEAARLARSWPKVPDMPQQPVATTSSSKPRALNTCCHWPLELGALVFRCSGEEFKACVGHGFNRCKVAAASVQKFLQQKHLGQRAVQVFAVFAAKTQAHGGVYAHQRQHFARGH